MASLITYRGGLRRIDFALSPNGPRRAVRLGRVNAKTAKATLARVETLIADKLTSRTHDAELCQWLGSLDEAMLERLRKVGLAEGVGVTRTMLGDFLKRAEAARDVKPSTRVFHSHTYRNLLEHFGPGRLLGDITEADADAWRAWLVEHERLAPATVARRVVAARTLWRMAGRWKLTHGNPFAGVKGGTQQNESRKRFITHDTIRRVIDACPDVEWRLLVGLARFGGLRTPSEPLALAWGDIDWDRGTIRVQSAKTAHHDGHAVRLVPLFPELRPLLLDAYEAAPEGTEHVITRYRDATQNLGTQLSRIVRRAGLEPWPRQWQNLRASRESELMREYDLSTACRWIGNSPAVAAKHYAMDTDRGADFRRAAGLPPADAPDEGQQKSQQKGQQSPPADDGHRMTPTRPDAGKPVENADFDADGQGVARGVKTDKWAIQDLNL